MAQDAALTPSKYYINLLRSSVMAGIAISLGCIVFLKVGGVAGAVLFSFGLLTVVHYKLPLFTGQAGFMRLCETHKLLVVLLGNVIGCLIAAVSIMVAAPSLCDAGAAVAINHTSLSIASQIILSVWCGFVMTTAVEFGRKKQYLPLLFGVPLFILCGFIHSIADAFYNFTAGNVDVWYTYPVLVLGNYLGCNLYRLFLNPSKSSDD